MLKLNLQSVLISSLQKHQNVCESMNKSNIKEKATGIPEASLSINLSFAHNIYIFFCHCYLHLACLHYAQNFIFISQLGADVSPDFHHQETTGHQSCVPSPRQPRRAAGWVKHNTNTTQTHKQIIFVRKRSSSFYLLIYFPSKGPCPCGIGAGSDEQGQHEELLQSCHYCGQARTIASKYLVMDFY